MACVAAAQGLPGRADRIVVPGVGRQTGQPHLVLRRKRRGGGGENEVARVVAVTDHGIGRHVGSPSHHDARRGRHLQIGAAGDRRRGGRLHAGQEQADRQGAEPGP